MRILVIGGHQVFGYGVAASKGFVDVLTESVSTLDHEQVTVDTLVHFSMEKTIEALMGLGNYISNYQLIIIQSGLDELDGERPWTHLFSDSFHSFNHQVETDEVYRKAIIVPSNLALMRELYRPNPTLKQPSLSFPCLPYIKRMLLNKMASTGKLGVIKHFERQLKVMINLLQNFKEKVILLGPQPSLNPCTQLLRNLGEDILKDVCKAQDFNWFKTMEVIEPHPYFFLTDGKHLNALGHRVLASQILRHYRFEVRKHQYYFQLCDN